MVKIQKINPFLWFDGQAEEASNFYVSVFKNSKILSTTRLPEGSAKNNVIVSFELEGQKFIALDGGPMFKFSPAISFVVNCESQEELDHFWEKLSEGAEKTNAAGLTTSLGCPGRLSPHPPQANAG